MQHTVNYRSTKGDHRRPHSAVPLSKLTRRLSRPRRPRVDWKLFAIRRVRPSVCPFAPVFLLFYSLQRERSSVWWGVSDM